MKGYTLMNQAKYQESIKYLDKALELNPSYIDAYNNKGLALQEMK
jgi:tetratricopeptide (TPR) repeat protein